ncbi:MAG TPA: protoheme IX farnesyltransferase [Fibrobacteres bacterium]|nr:protoheme IX farnesyltransferase [Fibrobacterota bacterium]
MERKAGRSDGMKFTERIMALLELFKLKMTLHILITTVAGFYLASPMDLDWMRLLWTLLGTGLLATSAFCFNQAMEKDLDSVMERTQRRPVPTERVHLVTAYVAGVLTCILGELLLWQKANFMTAFIGVLTVGLYAGVYTPMKRLTTLNTLVGGIPGALPPLMGWTAAQNHIGLGGLLLFAVLFFWQLPHFLALAWMYRDDYHRGGFKMLSLVDASGATCFRQIMVQTVLLLAVSLFPYWYGLAGEVYLITAVLSGLAMLWLARRLQKSGLRKDAVRLFLFTLAYLPVVLIAMALDKRILFIG